MVGMLETEEGGDTDIWTQWKTTLKGVVLPGAADDHLTVKLVNGYNVSYPLEMIDAITEIEIQFILPVKQAQLSRTKTCLKSQ